MGMNVPVIILELVVFWGLGLVNVRNRINQQSFTVSCLPGTGK